MDDKGGISKETIRGRAERIIAQSAKEPSTLSPETLKETVHELQVHQIELELQNEELRRLQLELEESRARYFDLYDLAPVGYITLNKFGLILEANLTLCSLLGVTRQALDKRPLTNFILPADQDIFYKHQRHIVETDAPQTFDLRLKHENGRVIWTRLQITLHLSPNDEPIYRTIISDISVNKQAEKALQKSHNSLKKALETLQQTQEKLVKQERLAAVGQMAAGIAHDFNNILAIITLYTDTSLKNPDLPQNLHSNLSTIAHQTGLATDLVQQIIDFGRQTILRLNLMDITLFLSKQVESWQQILPASTKIILSGETKNYVINADKTRIQQIFTNLILNARDAMPHGGILHIDLSHLRLNRPQIKPLFTLPAGDWVQITLRDSGIGIPPEVLAHIYEPFFTTKQPGKGSGLGLAQVYGIIKQHEGYIDVQSKEGQGTTFTIYLPELASAQVPTKTAVTTKKESPKGQGETILIVEDNAILAEALESALAWLNYKTLKAKNGVEALSILMQMTEEQNGVELDTVIGRHRVALILSDLKMPEMDGNILQQTLQKQGLKLPVVIMSGHPMKSEINSIQEWMLAGWLQKPVDIKELAILLDQILH